MVIIPKTEGNATPLGQRPLSVLPIENSLWATVRLEHLQAWCDSWLPLFSVLVKVGALLMLGTLHRWILRKLSAV